jgi:hypothetical protein
VAYMNFERLVSDPIAVAPSLSTTGHADFDRIRISVGSDFMLSLEVREAEELSDSLLSMLAVVEDLRIKRANEQGGGGE